jgi:hypothetical protein
MKSIISLLFITFLGSNHLHVVQDDGFIKIDKELAERKLQVQKIIPDKKYTYWEFVSNNRELRTEGKDANYRIKMPRGVFFVECLPSYCYSISQQLRGKL